MELEQAEYDLPSAIENALILVRERASRRGIRLGNTIDKGLGMIRGDERKVKQVLLNLLSNALKFTPEGGQIDVAARLYDDRAEVSVADTGVGIAPADQDAVFEEFRQVGTADKKAEGTGLGLTLSRKFIELHGGKIWVQSEVGQGSTFTFHPPGEAMAGELILIVEDNDKNRKLVRDVLTFKGYTTIEAETGEAGVRLAQERRPNLVLMDIRLPGIDGMEALRQLRAEPTTREIPVMAMTASVMSEDRRRVMGAGFDAYQGKPIQVNDFLAAVAQTLEHRRT